MAYDSVKQEKQPTCTIGTKYQVALSPSKDIPEHGLVQVDTQPAANYLDYLWQ